MVHNRQLQNACLNKKVFKLDLNDARELKFRIWLGTQVPGFDETLTSNIL